MSKSSARPSAPTPTAAISCFAPAAPTIARRAEPEPARNWPASPPTESFSRAKVGFRRASSAAASRRAISRAGAGASRRGSAGELLSAARRSSTKIRPTHFAMESAGMAQRSHSRCRLSSSSCANPADQRMKSPEPRGRRPHVDSPRGAGASIGRSLQGARFVIRSLPQSQGRRRPHHRRRGGNRTGHGPGLRRSGGAASASSIPMSKAGARSPTP